MSAKEGYKGHRVGTRAAEVHKVFDTKGAEAAKKKARALGVQDGCTYSWLRAWGGKTSAKKKASSAGKEKSRAKVAKTTKSKARAKVDKDSNTKAKPKTKKPAKRAVIEAPAADAA